MGFMGYTLSKLAKKAEKRGISTYEYALNVSAKKNNGIPMYDKVRQFFETV